MTSLPPTPGLDEDMSGVPLTKRSTDWPLGGHSAEPSRRMVNEVGFEEQGGFDDGVGGAKGLRLEEMQREDLVCVSIDGHGGSSIMCKRQMANICRKLTATRS